MDMASAKNGVNSKPSNSLTLFNLDDSSSFDISNQEAEAANATAAPTPTPNININQNQQSRRSAYGLASTQSSKEVQFDLDNDSIDSDDEQRLNLISSDSNHPISPTSRDSNRTGDGVNSLMDRLTNPIVGRQSLDELGRNLRNAASNAVPGWDGEGIPDWLKRGGSVFEGTVNMANSILGAGIVGLPYSMRESGFFAGLGLLIGLSFLTDWTIRLIVLNAKLSGRGTYIEIMEHCFGSRGKAAVSLFQFAFAFGGMCAFCVVIGDTIPHVLTWLFPSLMGSFLTSRQFVITICTLLISYPLSLYRNIESLSKASAIALFSMVLIIVTVIIRGPAMPAELKGDPSLRFTIINPINIVRSIAVISFAFVCHHNSLLIYGSLREPTMDRFGKVTHYSTMIAAGGAISMSVAGYWSFEDKTLSNVLNNFPEDDTMVNIARFCFGVNMFTTFPLEAFVCREVLEHYFFNGDYEFKRHMYFTTSIVVSSLIVSLLSCDLGIFLELTGGLSATALAFIFPSICYLHLSNEGGHRSLEAGSFPGLSSSNSSSRRSRNQDSSNSRRNEDEEEDEEDLEDLEGRVDMDDLELPLRPGANLRHRPASSKRSWFHSTKPLAVAVAIFGVVVLCVSVGTALVDVFTGRNGATHQCR